MELDENFKHLMQELGEAINESLADSEKVSGVMGRIRASGYDLFLVLEVTIGFNKRGDLDVVERKEVTSESAPSPQFVLDTHDAQFLRALKISMGENHES